MKKAGTCPAFVSDRSGLLLVHLVSGLLLAVLRLFLGLLLAVLFVHRGLLVHLLHLVHLLVLRDRGNAHGRKHCRDEDCKELLHRHPLLWLIRKDRPRAQSASYNAAADVWLTALLTTGQRPGGIDCKSI